jgi:peptidyl-tRNA hydrolase, PTH1 family
VGLGNPGKAYARHRHNLGFMVVDEIASGQRLSWRTNPEKTLVCEARMDSTEIMLAKPQTFMNLSGKSVWPMVRRLNIDPSAIIVIHDDLDLAPGKVRVKVGGGDGGHKGIRSIADSLRFQGFIRIRLGIGRPPEGVSAEQFVLHAFSPDETELLKHLILTGLSAVRECVMNGVEHCKNIIHLVKPPQTVASETR